MTYRLIRTKAKLTFLKHCKNNNVFPSHLTNSIKIKCQLHHKKANSRIESLLYRFKRSALNIEIFDLYRLIGTLQKELVQNSFNLSKCLPTGILNAILKDQFNLYVQYRKKLEFSHRNKLNWLIDKSYRSHLQTRSNRLTLVVHMTSKG